jgi:hypothetical protein
MTKSMLLLIGLFFAVPLGLAGAQTVNQRATVNPQTINQGETTNQGNRTVLGNQGLIGRPPFQSLSPARTPCSAGSQSVRVCNNDFQSCSSYCSALAMSDPTADIGGCTLRCCNNFSACLSIRGCANLTSLNCFSPTSPSVVAPRGGPTAPSVGGPGGVPSPSPSVGAPGVVQTSPSVGAPGVVQTSPSVGAPGGLQ